MNMPFFRNLSSVLGIRALLGLFSLLLNPLPFYLSFQRSSSLVPKNTSLSPSCVTWSHWVYILSYLIVHYRFLYKLPVSSFSPSPCHLIYEFLNTWNCILFIVLDTFMLLDFIMTEVVLSGRSSLIKWNEMKQYFSKMKSLQCLWFNFMPIMELSFLIAHSFTPKYHKYIKSTVTVGLGCWILNQVLSPSQECADFHFGERNFL